LPVPFSIGVGVFPFQGIGQVDGAAVAFQVCAAGVHQAVRSEYLAIPKRAFGTDSTGDQFKGLVAQLIGEEVSRSSLPLIVWLRLRLCARFTAAQAWSGLCSRQRA
jgi:hypothetical protein